MMKRKRHALEPIIAKLREAGGMPASNHKIKDMAILHRFTHR